MIAALDFWIDVAGVLIIAWGLAIVASCVIVAAAIVIDIRRERREIACRLPAPVIPLDLSRERRRQAAARARGRAAR